MIGRHKKRRAGSQENDRASQKDERGLMSDILKGIIVAVAVAALVGGKHPWWYSYLARAPVDLNRYCANAYGSSYRSSPGKQMNDWACVSPANDRKAMNIAEACQEQYGTTAAAKYNGVKWYCQKEDIW
jgi:hypothetical protein